MTLCKYGCGNPTLPGSKICDTSFNRCPAIKAKHYAWHSDPIKRENQRVAAINGVKRVRGTDEYWKARAKQGQTLSRTMTQFKVDFPEEFTDRCKRQSTGNKQYLESHPDILAENTRRISTHHATLKVSSPEEFVQLRGKISAGLTKFKQDTDKYLARSEKLRTFQHSRWDDLRNNNPELYEKRLQILESVGRRGKRGRYNGIFYQSSWELAWILFHLDNETPFTRNTDRFTYTGEDGRLHTYTPDFKVFEYYWVEIKGWKKQNNWEQKLQQFPHPDRLIVLYDIDISTVLEYAVAKYGKKFYDSVKVGFR